MRKLVLPATIASLLLIAAPVAAVAVEVDPAPAGAQVADYTPEEPTAPSLLGSIAVAECEGDVPWIDYSITLNDPDDLSTTNTAFLVMTNGSEEVEIELGEIVDGSLSGRALWPGAGVDGSGQPNAWPGWTQNAAGEWTETAGNYAWTRGDISASIRTNPDLAVALSYPQATPVCAAAPPSATVAAAGVLPATGLDAAVVPLSIAGGVIVIAGVGFVLLQRRKRSHI